MAAMHDEFAVTRLCDQAGLDELTHKIGSDLPSLMVCLHTSQSALHFFQLGCLDILEHFELCLGCFLFLDLGLSPSAL